MTEADSLGPILAPPKGGLETLKRLVEQEKPASRFDFGYWIAAGSAISIAALVTISILVWGRGVNHKEQIHEAVQQALAPPAKTFFTNAAYKEIQTGNSNVRILVVASLKKAD